MKVYSRLLLRQPVVGELINEKSCIRAQGLRNWGSLFHLDRVKQYPLNSIQS